MSPLRLCYYGDDFTGSTDVMESLTFAGLRTILFLEPPTEEDIAAFEDVEAIGVAGRTRSLGTGAMEAELAPVFEAFNRLGPSLVHYKTCSTFDSAPDVGSIGRAIDTGAGVFGSPYVPLVVGAPALRRYCVFGNLFASSGLDSDVYRLDRHPTMQRHPVTPMDEADVRVHLGRQTDKTIALMNTVALRSSDYSAEFSGVREAGAGVVLFDTVSDEELARVGELVWESREKGRTLFAAGSSGLEYALVAYWRESGELESERDVPKADRVDQLVVVSGSCSPVTADQIAWAESDGFRVIGLDTPSLVTPDEADGAIERSVREALGSLEGGASVLLHAGRGPDDPRIPADIGATCTNLWRRSKSEGGRVDRGGPRTGDGEGSLPVGSETGGDNGGRYVLLRGKGVGRTRT